MESFQELPLPEFLRQSLKHMNFVKPTPVQAQAVPPALEGKDVIASAQTGTGKTGAFGIPLLAYLSANTDKTALVLTPTRELAEQVLAVLRRLSGNTSPWGSVLLIGGANMASQFKILSRKPRLIIGTPGRVIDHLTRGSLSLAHTGFLVLDEADRMLDMGFAPQLDEIRKHLTAKRQTLLFSATLPPNIKEMASQYLKDPVRITVGATTQPVAKIAQMVIHTSEARKPEELMNELKTREGSVLVFARTQHRVDRITDRLKEQGVKVTRIHGGRTQAQRKQAIDHFREGHYRVLLATDIAARGLDIHHIAHVINYDLPRNPEDYIHRVGRTARMGAEGSSLCFLTPEDRELWNRILRLTGASKDSIQTKPSMFGNTAPQEQRHLGQRPERGRSHHREFKPKPHFDRHQGRPAAQDASHHKPFAHIPVGPPGNQGRPPLDEDSIGNVEQGPSRISPFVHVSPFVNTSGDRSGERHGRPEGGGPRRYSPSGNRQGRPPFERYGQKESGYQKNRNPEGRHQKRSDQFQSNRFRGRNTQDANFVFHGKDNGHQGGRHSSLDRERDGNRTPFDNGRGKRKPEGFFKRFASKFGSKDGQSRPFSREGHPSFRRDNRPGWEHRGHPSGGQRPHRFGDNHGNAMPFSGDRPVRPEYRGGEGHRFNKGPRPGGRFKPRPH